MARRSPIERDARRIASDALQGTRRRRKSDTTAWQALEDAVQICERLTAHAVVSDDIPRARRTARAGQLLDEAQIRLVARQRRDTAHKLERAGIVPNARVVVVRTGYGANAAPTGTVLTLEDVTDTYYLWGTDDDGHRWLVNCRDLEVAADAPAVEPPVPHDVVERAEPEPAVVVITREKVRPVRVRPGARYLRDGEGLYHWTYNYTVDGGPLCQYGPSLQSLVDMLKRRQPGATVVKSWAVTK